MPKLIQVHHISINKLEYGDYRVYGRECLELKSNVSVTIQHECLDGWLKELDFIKCAWLRREADQVQGYVNLERAQVAWVDESTRDIIVEGEEADNAVV